LPFTYSFFVVAKVVAKVDPNEILTN